MMKKKNRASADVGTAVGWHRVVFEDAKDIQISGKLLEEIKKMSDEKTETLDALLNKLGNTAILDQETGKREKRDTASRLGAFLVELLCCPADRKALIGDLLEAYEDIRETHGDKRANAWFRVQVFWTAASLLRSRIGNLGMALLGFAASWIGGKISF